MLCHGFSVTLAALCLLSKQVLAAPSNAGTLSSRWSSIVSEGKSEVSSLCSKFIGTKTAYVTATVTSVSTSMGSTTVINTGFSTDTLLTTTVIDETTVLMTTTVLTSTSYSTSTSVAVVPATSETDTTITPLSTTFLTLTSYNTTTSTSTVPEVDTVDVTSTVYASPISTSVEIATVSVTATIPFVSTVTNYVCGATVTATSTSSGESAKLKIREAGSHAHQQIQHRSLEMSIDKRDLISDAFEVIEVLDSSFLSSECSKLIVPPATTSTYTTTALAGTTLTTTIAGSSEVVSLATSIAEDFSAVIETTTVTVIATVASVIIVVPTSTSYTDVTSTFESTSTVTSVATLTSEVIVVVTATSTDDVFSTAIATSIVPSTTVTDTTSTVSFTTISTSTTTVTYATTCSVTQTQNACFPTNLIQNPSFETGNTDDYTDNLSGHLTSYGVIKDLPNPFGTQSGSYVYQVTFGPEPNNENGASGTLEQSGIPVLPATDYNFSMLVKSTPVSAGNSALCTVYVGGLINSTAGFEIASAYFAFGSPAIQTMTGSFITGQETNFTIRIYTTCNGTSTATTLYYDDLDLQCSG